MPNRDYAVRNKKKGINASLIIILILLLILVSGGVLWLLKENVPNNTIPTQTAPTQQSKSTLPSPPEEMYSYIRDLETREVPIDRNSKLAKLTKEQEQQIQRQKELEQRQQEQAKEKVSETQMASSEISPDLATEVALKKAQQEKKAQEKLAQEKKLQEERRKQAEQKQQEIAKKTAEQKAKIEAAKPKDTPRTVGKYGLQCGAFKNKAQAENMQARLAMAGYNAKINSNGEWNRVVVGPIGDRASAVSAQSNAKSVAECLVVGM